MRQFSSPITVGLLALTLLLGSQPGRAAVDPYRLYLAERGDIPWQSLSPEEQKALRHHRGKWDSYSSERQKSMRQGTQRYLKLPPEKRREVEQQRRQYEQLSPEERRRLREKYRREHR
ncbi:MAG TPA: DUF3106 domain-containing protein [Gammaproteobacteria bacterium]|nr:DUF3106 domain-containing protein [Gammaproteobacteria bacterium]